MALSDMQCRTAKPKSKPYKLFDFEGLYLEVMPSGSKYWRQKYRIHGKEKRISHGGYPDISLAEARQKKLAVRGDLKKGLNPALVRLEQQQTAAFVASQNFKDIALEWYNKQVGQWKPRYAQTVLHRLEKYAFPELGSYPVHMIKPIIILNCLQKIEKTANEIPRRVKNYIHHIFLYAIATERAEQDPTYGLEHALKKYKRGHFASITVDEMPKFLLGLHEHKARMTHQTFLAIMLMFSTFVRTSELIKSTWDEIHFEKALWVIPPERMKMDNPHLVPLSRQALSILLELKEMNGNREYIFPHHSKPRKHMSNGTILQAIKRMGYKKRMTGHGFRSLALGLLKEKLGFSHEIANRQLAHVPKDSTDRAYDRAQFLPQRTEMMQRYADYLENVYVTEISKKYSVNKILI